MGESFLTLWPKHSSIAGWGGRREGRGSQKLQKPWHIQAGDKGHLLVCLKEGQMCIPFPLNMPGKHMGESMADALQYTLLSFLTVDLGI